MNNKLINKLFDSIYLKILITVIGVIGAGITIYLFVIDNKVDLNYEIIANTNVLDYNAEISKLEVTYDSINLKQVNENLRIYTIKIINKGNQDILKEYYDENDPIGIKISSGQIIERPEIIETSSHYLKKNIVIKQHELDKITFSRVILESNEFYIIKLLILHKKDSIPQIISYGKVAGQKTINVQESMEEKDDFKMIFKKNYGGNFLVQMTRFSFYFPIGGLIFLIIAMSIDKIVLTKEKKRKGNIITKFKSSKTHENKRDYDPILDIYIKYNVLFLKQIYNFISNEEELNIIYTKLSEEAENKILKRYEGLDLTYNIFYDSNDWWKINRMIKVGILIKENSKLIINSELADALYDFLKFLNQNSEYKKNREYLNKRTFAD